MSLKTITTTVILAVISLVLFYAIFLVIVSWPINDFSIDKAGLFGDSFGVLNSLFSGLAFAGIIVTVLLQKEELKLQRKELARSSLAQDRTARLMALTELLANYKSNIKINSGTLNDMVGALTQEQLTSINQETDKLVVKRDRIIVELEALINA